jgi:hypothetical protein
MAHIFISLFVPTGFLIRNAKSTILIINEKEKPLID